MAFLILADGTVFHGVSVGVPGYAVGEVVFNTSQTGYQEILSDPSYFGQIIVFTMPHIGNVGINHIDNESHKTWLKGAIFRSLSEDTSHWQAKKSLKTFLNEQNMISISELDTRALTQHLRDHGSQNGCIVSDPAISKEEALVYAKKGGSLNSQNLAKKLSTTAPYVYQKSKNWQYHIIVIDYGVKQNILHHLAQSNIKITVIPMSFTFDQILTLKADGIVLSNGPGDPVACDETIATIKQILEFNIPLLGICLGHQLFALACGGKTKKMDLGHHGANHPVKCLTSNRVFISSQNHGYVVDEEGFPTCLEVTHRSLFDNTIAGLKYKGRPFFSFQGHPEANPGPTELHILFHQFILEVQSAQKNGYS